MSIVSVSGKCEVNVGLYRCIPTKWPVIEKHFETLRIKCDVRKLTGNLVRIISIIYTNQL